MNADITSHSMIEIEIGDISIAFMAIHFVEMQERIVT